VFRHTNTQKISLKITGEESERLLCVQQEDKVGKGKGRRSKTICAECEKGLHGECFAKNKYAK
jgi:hypothetical protein